MDGFVSLTERRFDVCVAFTFLGNVTATKIEALVGIAKTKKTLFGPQIEANQVPVSKAIIGPILCIPWLVPIRVPASLFFETAYARVERSRIAYAMPQRTRAHNSGRKPVLMPYKKVLSVAIMAAITHKARAPKVDTNLLIN